MYRINRANIPNFFAKNIHAIAWVVLILSVVISIFVRLPFGFYDEQVHYIRALGVANNQLLSHSLDGDMSRLGHEVDESNIKYINTYLHEESVVSTSWLVGEGSKLSLSGNDEYVVNTSAAAYTPVPYLSYALASKFSQAIDLSVKNEFILMRLSGAVLSLAILFLAFRLSPVRYRWTILAVSLIPMCIASFSSISADGFTIAVAVLFMAATMRFIVNTKTNTLKRQDTVILCAAMILLVLAKMPVFLMLALIPAILVIYWKKIKNSYKVSLVGAVVFAAMITVAWAYYARDINTGAFWGRDVDTMKQLGFIVANPFVFLFNLANSVLSYNYLELTYNVYANSKFFQNIPFIIDVILILGLALSPFVVKQAGRVTAGQVWVYRVQFVLFISIVLAIFTLLYLQFTPIGTKDAIEGVQPRYFIPLLPLILMMPYKLNLSARLKSAVYAAPFVGVFVYWFFIAVQLQV